MTIEELEEQGKIIVELTRTLEAEQAMDERIASATHAELVAALRMASLHLAAYIQQHGPLPPFVDYRPGVLDIMSLRRCVI